MGLDQDQVTELAELPARRAVVQTPGNPVPFLIRVLDLSERIVPPTEEIERRERQTLESLDYEPGDEDVSTVLFGDRKKAQAEEQDKEPMRGDTLRVFVRICEKPFEPIPDRVDALDMDRSKEQRLRVRLVHLGMIEGAGKVGGKRQFHVPTKKGVEWAQQHAIQVYRYKGSIIHEVMVRKVREALEQFSPRIKVISEGEALGSSGVQPDLLLRIDDYRGDSSRRAAIQISYRNRPDYEIDRALELQAIQQIDQIVVVTRDKRSRDSMERKLAERVTREGGAREDVSASAQAIRILDFESCTRSAYDWGWLFGDKN